MLHLELGSPMNKYAREFGQTLRNTAKRIETLFEIYILKK